MEVAGPVLLFSWSYSLLPDMLKLFSNDFMSLGQDMHIKLQMRRCAQTQAAHVPSADTQMIVIVMKVFESATYMRCISISLAVFLLTLNW